MRRIWAPFVMGAGLVVAVTSPAGAQGLDRIVNGGFDENLDGWAVVAYGTSTGTWSVLDAGGAETSGSARMEMAYAGPGNANAVNLLQCVAAAPGEPHSFGASIRRQAGGGEGEGFVRVQWFESDDCSGPTFDTSDAAVFLPDETWVLVQLVDAVPSGAAARSALVSLINLSQDVSAPHVVFFDDAFFVPEPGAAFAGVVALTALAALRMRRA